MKTFFIPTAAVLLAVAAGCGQEPQPQAQQAPLVYVTQALERNIERGVTVIGETVPVNSIELNARVRGYMIERNFEAGQTVKKGDVLVKIEPDEYQAALDLAKAELDKAKADLNKTTIDFERQKELVEKHAVSQRDYDNAVAAKMNSEADVAAAEAQIKTAELNLSYTTITAPFDGRIGFWNYSVGQLLNPDTSGTLATLVSVDPIYVDFNVSELAFLDMKISREKAADLVVRLELMNKTVYPIDGKIYSDDNEVQASTGTLKVRAVFDNPDCELLPGMYVRVSVLTRGGAPRVLVPRIALASDIRGDYLFVVNQEGKVERRDLKLGSPHGEWQVVLEGVAAGDTVITSGVQKSRIGSAVNAQPDPSFEKKPDDDVPPAPETAA